MQIKGKIKLIEDVQQVSDSFKKREFVVITEDQYPQHILIQCTQDRCGLLDSVKVGDDVEVSINIRGREWLNPKDNTVRHFNSIEAWKIEPVGTAQSEVPVDDDLPWD